MTPRGFRLKTQADDALAMWRRREYDNLKDAILDARDLLKRARADLPPYVPKLEQMLLAASSQLERLAAKDPDMATYAKGILGT
jgi:hypothetical protein